LAAAVKEFEACCAEFIKNSKKNSLFKPIEPSILRRHAFDQSNGESIHQASEIFGQTIAAISQSIRDEQQIESERLRAKIRDFLTGLYPVVRRSLDLIATIAEVY
jgi:hypothetical protein